MYRGSCRRVSRDTGVEQEAMVRVRTGSGRNLVVRYDKTARGQEDNERSTPLW